jgi:hypothetical protein
MGLTRHSRHAFRTLCSLCLSTLIVLRCAPNGGFNGDLGLQVQQIF